MCYGRSCSSRLRWVPRKGAGRDPSTLRAQGRILRSTPQTRTHWPGMYRHIQNAPSFRTRFAGLYFVIHWGLSASGSTRIQEPLDPSKGGTRTHSFWLPALLWGLQQPGFLGVCCSPRESSPCWGSGTPLPPGPRGGTLSTEGLTASSIEDRGSLAAQAGPEVILGLLQHGHRQGFRAAFHTHSVLPKGGVGEEPLLPLQTPKWRGPWVCMSPA